MTTRELMSPPAETPTGRTHHPPGPAIGIKRLAAQEETPGLLAIEQSSNQSTHERSCLAAAIPDVPRIVLASGFASAQAVMMNTLAFV